MGSNPDHRRFSPQLGPGASRVMERRASRTTRSSATGTARRSSPPPGRSTGSACRASTRAPTSPRSSAAPSTATRSRESDAAPDGVVRLEIDIHTDDGWPAGNGGGGLVRHPAAPQLWDRRHRHAPLVPARHRRAPRPQGASRAGTRRPDRRRADRLRPVPQPRGTVRRFHRVGERRVGTGPRPRHAERARPLHDAARPGQCHDDSRPAETRLRPCGEHRYLYPGGQLGPARALCSDGGSRSQ